MKVEVRPLPIKRWHGKEGKESFTQPKSVEVLFNEETGRYATGLTPEEAAEYGAKMKVDLSDTYNPNEPHPYWSAKTSWIPLPNRTLFFETNKDADYIKVKNMKASKLVANSVKEYEEGKWPFATHVIFDQAEEISVKAVKVQLKRKINEMLTKATLDQKAGIVMIVSKESIKNRSQDFIDVEIDALVEERPADVLEVLEMGSERVNIMSQIYLAYFQGILHKEGEAFYYMSELLGATLDDTVGFFRHPDNQKLKVSILQKIK